MAPVGRDGAGPAPAFSCPSVLPPHPDPAAPPPLQTTGQKQEAAPATPTVERAGPSALTHVVDGAVVAAEQQEGPCRVIAGYGAHVLRLWGREGRGSATGALPSQRPPPHPPLRFPATQASVAGGWGESPPKQCSPEAAPRTLGVVSAPCPTCPGGDRCVCSGGWGGCFLSEGPGLSPPPPANAW